ncbi:hypothetical protein ACOMHN_037986 [Nucella lapillus]
MAATPSVTCSVVQLAQHLDRVALPTPIPSHHVSRRPQRESHGGFRWHRPAFQPFQLKPWARDLDLETEMRDSLAVMGPNHRGGPSTPAPTLLHRSSHHRVLHGYAQREAGPCQDCPGQPRSPGTADAPHQTQRGHLPRSAPDL